MLADIFLMVIGCAMGQFIGYQICNVVNMYLERRRSK